MKYSHHPLPDTYHAILQSRPDLVLTIVGRDPFPTGATGIPFCKDTWRELMMDNCSGSHVMASLGINLVEVSKRLEAPQDLFYALATKGIAFLNASYHLLGDGRITKRDCVYVEKGVDINMPLIEKSQAVILCGQACLLAEFVDRKDMIACIHPDAQNRKYNRPSWESAWLLHALKDTFGLDLTIE